MLAVEEQVFCTVNGFGLPVSSGKLLANAFMTTPGVGVGLAPVKVFWESPMSLPDTALMAAEGPGAALLHPLLGPACPVASHEGVCVSAQALAVGFEGTGCG